MVHAGPSMGRNGPGISDNCDYLWIRIPNFMAGVYIHIPFCRQACHYCNFHFSVSLGNKDAYLEALLSEMALRKRFFDGSGKGEVLPHLDTIYFGGGTPSLLSTRELMVVFDGLSQFFSWDGDSEITLEANPDDLTPKMLVGLAKTPINRLSIGIQSFHQADLHYMNRSHSAEQAICALDSALEAGFHNITVDLIYGTPTMDHAAWIQNLDMIVTRDIPHISAYALTLENKTPLDFYVRKGKMLPPEEEKMASQYESLIEYMEENGYAHYEVSNFARKGFQSRHNMSYWTGLPYLGLGASAHSHVSGMRCWNPSNTSKYIQTIKKGVLPLEEERLTPVQQLNEYIMVSLRTSMGCSLDHIGATWGAEKSERLRQAALVYLDRGWMQVKEDHLTLNGPSMFFADGIAAELFFES